MTELERVADQMRYALYIAHDYGVERDVSFIQKAIDEYDAWLLEKRKRDDREGEGTDRCHVEGE